MPRTPVTPPSRGSHGSARQSSALKHAAPKHAAPQVGAPGLGTPQRAEANSPEPRHAAAKHPQGAPRWRFSALTLFPVVLTLAGVLALLYPSTASWFSRANQQHTVQDYQSEIANISPDPEAQLAQARLYNDALISGAELQPYESVPTGAGSIDYSGAEYDDLLVANSTGLMGRVLIPSINVDLPIYHGTSHETLLMGAGHLQGTSLPVGGQNTHSVVTAHRGLAESRMFTDLDKMRPGDRFTVDILGEALTYEVVHTQVVEPHESEPLRFQANRDLMTLVTCTPLGINSHRILVTGERVYPTPPSEVERVLTEPEGAGFPWWAVGFGAAISAVAVYVWVSGRPRSPRQANASATPAGASETAVEPAPTADTNH